MECFLNPWRTRTFFKCLSFGAILLWILCGSYVRHEPVGATIHADREGELGRHLLSTSEKQLEVGGANFECEDLYYSKSGKSVQSVDKEDKCSKIHSLASNFSSCNFIHCVEGCSNDDGILNYLHFIYCVMPTKLIPLAMTLLFLWLIFLFIFLGATAEEYFCPALTVISSILRLSQNVAGVTLLALGNGAPDIFSAFAAVNQDEPQKASLAVGALFGAGMFVTTIVVGAVTVTKPFTLTQRPFLRDIIFYIFAVYWTFFLLWGNSMTIFNAAGFVVLYVFYVIVVIVGRVIFQRWKKWRKKTKLGTGDMPRAPSPPDGKEMDHSDATSTAKTSSGLATLGALLPGTGLAGSYTQQANGQLSIQADNSNTGNKDKEETEEIESEEQRIFRISSIGSSEMSSSGVVNRPVICIQRESESEGSPLFPRMNAAEKRRTKELAGASLPPLLAQVGQNHDSLHHQRMGGAVEQGYGSISVNIQKDSGSRSPSPTSSHRRPIRKTISGALDVTEGIGAAFGIPHVPELWEEVNRAHSRSRSNSYRARARSRSRTHSTRSAVEGEDRHSSKDRTPLLGPTLAVPGSTQIVVEDDDRDSEESEEGEDEMAPVVTLQSRKKRHPFVKLLLQLWPFGESFKELGLLGKIYEICKSPAGFLLTLTVPVIDTNEDDHNWNKWLNVLHCVTAPLLISLITNLRVITIGGVFPLWTLLLIIGTLLAILVACTSHSDKPPVYHCVFAWVGFIVAVVWIYSIANEIVNLLQAFGIVIKLSDGILGLTLLAWGNSVGDAVSNVTMAKQGFPRMAIGACFGGPLLNMLLGIGIASVVKSIRKKAEGFKFELIFTQVELCAALFLLASLVCTLITVSVLKFRMRRFYGIFLVGVYVVFLTVAILAEAKVFQIHIDGVITVETD